MRTLLPLHTGSNVGRLTLRKKNNRFDITHSPANTKRELIYSFARDLVPLAMMRHLYALGINRHRELNYTLNAAEEKAVAEVLAKLDHEQHTATYSHASSSKPT